jgi:hypothetical protein
MKRWLIVGAAVAVILGTGAMAWGNIIQDFNSGGAGYRASTVNNGGGIGYFSPTYSGSHGNNGGYVWAPVDAGSNRLYGFEPGDKSPFADITGMELTVDTKINGRVTGPGSQPTVRFYVGSTAGGSNYFVTKDTYSWDINQDNSWETHAVELLAQNFLEWPNQATHNLTFADVISHITDIGLVFTDTAANFGNNAFLGFSSHQGTTIKLDNFGVKGGDDEEYKCMRIPEPSTAALVILGALFMRRRITTIRP